MPTSLALLLLAGLVIGLLILYAALAMAGHQSDLERQADALKAMGWQQWPNDNTETEKPDNA